MNDLGHVTCLPRASVGSSVKWREAFLSGLLRVPTRGQVAAPQVGRGAEEGGDVRGHGRVSPALKNP